MSDMMKGGTTLLFVSHSEAQVKELCQKAAWLEHGVVQYIGNVDAAFAEYRDCANQQ